MSKLNAIEFIVKTLSLLVFCIIPLESNAQNRPLPQISTLLNAVVIKDELNEAEIELRFDKAIQRFGTTNQGNDKISLDLPFARKSIDLNLLQMKGGLISDISISENGTALQAIFTSKAIVISKPQKRGNSIIINLKAKTPQRNITSESTEKTNKASLPEAKDPANGEDSYEMIVLKYADVSEVVGLLTDGITVKPNDSFTPREPGFGALGAANSNYTGQTTPSAPEVLPLGQAVDTSLAIDRRLNAVLIKGSSDRVSRLKEQIKLIDVPVPSVLIETQFLELSENGVKNLGIDFSNANGQIAVGAFQKGQYVPYGSSFEGGLKSIALQAAIYAQIQEGHGRILSKPRISAQSGGSARIITGDALPILTAITLSGVNGVSQQVQYVNVGVTLQIAPRVSEDNFVSSRIFCVVSSVTGYSQGYPTISQRQAETSATVRDGESFIIGGLTQENNISTKNKMPIVNKLPILNNILGTQVNNHTKTELFIIITPHVIRQVANGQAQPAQ